MQLLTDEYKLLKQVIEKGKSGDFSDVRRWFKLMIENVDKLCELLKSESQH